MVKIQNNSVCNKTISTFEFMKLFSNEDNARQFFKANGGTI